MSFEIYKDLVISDFEEDCQQCDILENLTDKQKEEINERFEEHKACYSCKEEFDKENLELFNSCIYGINANVSIECNNCDEVIIDSEILLLKEEE